MSTTICVQPLTYGAELKHFFNAPIPYLMHRVKYKHIGVRTFDALATHVPQSTYNFSFCVVL